MDGRGEGRVFSRRLWKGTVFWLAEESPKIAFRIINIPQTGSVLVKNGRSLGAFFARFGPKNSKIGSFLS